MNSLPKQIQESIKAHALLEHGTHLLVGVSGGADSVAMLHALVELAPTLELTLTVAHLNHGIRDVAAEDARFVETLCQSLGVAFTSDSVNVPTLAKNAGVSLEMAARDARYHFFATAAAAVGANAVATAHTQDDQAETVLLKLIRGAGCSGLNGIARSSIMQGLSVIRPLLDTTRESVEAYLRERGLRWKEDATNQDTRLKRNRIRHDVLPLLEEHLNPRVKEALAKTAEILTEENAYMSAATAVALKLAQKTPTSLTIPILLQQSAALQRRVLQQWLILNGITAQQLRFEVIERLLLIMRSSSGSGCVTLSSECEARREYDLLHFMQKETPIIEIPKTRIITPGNTLLDSVDIQITTSLREGFDRTATGPLGKLPAEACIRWNNDSFPEIHVRSWHPGDRISPLGMTGSCKLHDLFVDAKIPQSIRKQIPLFFCGDEVVWLPGYRIARNWAVLDEKQRSLQLRVTAK